MRAASHANELERVLTEHALLKAIVDGSPFPTWVKRNDGVMLYANPAYERVYGVPARDYVGAVDADFWTAETAAAFGDNDAVVLAKGRRAWFQEPVKPPGGAVRVETICKWPARLEAAQGEIVAIAGQSVRPDKTGMRDE